MTRAIDGKPAIIKQAADMTDQHDLMGLVIAPIAAPFNGFELGKLLLPITQDMRLDRTEFPYLTNGEIAFGRNGGKPAFRQVLCCHFVSRPVSSVSDWHEM